jgi:hypothetical protein
MQYRQEAVMSAHDAASPLPEARRQEIFLALVAAQDSAMSVPESRQYIADRFGVQEPEVRQIEREGLEKGWPPL